jgi:hypothetical protein
MQSPISLASALPFAGQWLLACAFATLISWAVVRAVLRRRLGTSAPRHLGTSAPRHLGALPSFTGDGWVQEDDIAQVALRFEPQPHPAGRCVTRGRAAEGVTAC